MKLSLILASLWVLASTITALLPMRKQFIPGVTLLILAPFLLVYIGYETSYWVALLGLAAFVSMFRNPLRYFLRRALGLPVQLPRELERKEK